MYSVELLTKDDKLKGNMATNLPQIRNISVTSGRVILTDLDGRMRAYRPDELDYLTFFHYKE